MQPLEPDASEPESESIDASLPTSGGLTNFLVSPAAGHEGVLEPGTRLGDVTIIRFIAEGGMGRVYEGLQGMPCRTVAVKLVRPGVLSKASLKRFEHEAHILGRLTHSGIARIYSMGVQHLHGGDVPYFVMEYIDEARPLTAYATDHDLSTLDRLKLFRKACEAVAHGHQRGVIHRDLKPGNILVDAAGQTKIIDFGVARSTDGDVSLTTMLTDVGQLVGTVQYMCPEQFEGNPEELDVRADVYALGVVLYELLTGRLPYDVAKRPVYAVARVVKEAEPTPLAAVSPKFRGDLDTIVMHCLEKDRARRYSSAAELEADLGRYLAGEPITASPPRFLDAVVRLARRHRLAALAAAGLLTAIVAGGVGASIFAVKAARDRESALREKARADAEADVSRYRLYLANLRSLQAATNARNLRLGRQLYAENLAIVGNPPPLEMKILCAGLDDALAVLTWGRGPVRDVKYSPDGRLLAATCIAGDKWRTQDDLKRLSHAGSLHLRKGNLLFFRVDGQRPYERLDSPDDEWSKLWNTQTATNGLRSVDDPSALPLAICAEGRRLAVQTPDGRIRIVESETGEEQVILEKHHGRLNVAAFSPKGNRLAILGTNKSLGIWDPASGRLGATLGETDDRFMAFQFSPDGSRLAAVRLVQNRRQEVCVFDAADGHHLSTVTKQGGFSQIDCLLAFSPDGSRLVTNQHHDGELHVWDAVTGARTGSLARNAGIVTALAFSPDGRQIAGGFTTGTIRLLNASDCATERELLGHDGTVTTLAFHPDGASLASGSQDGTIRIWSRTVAEPLAVLADHPGMTAAAFSPDGSQLAVAPRGGGCLELWNPRTAERLHALETAPGLVAQVIYSPDGRLVAAAVKNEEQPGEARVWSSDSGVLVATLGGIARGAERIVFSPDGSRLLTTSGDATLAVWNPRTGDRLMSTAFDYRGRFVDAGAVFGLGGTRVAYRMPQLLDAETAEAKVTLPPQGHVTCLAASPDGLTCAAGMAIGSVNLAEFATGRRFASLLGHTDAVRAISFSADGTRIATGSLDASARLWDARTGAEIRVFKGHEGAVETVLLTADGSRIVTASRDGSARIWDAETGHELCTLPAPRDFPRSVALSPDGALVLSAAADHGVRIWGLSNAAVVAARKNR
jgi:WD40 repeat protein/tRNA A-37 threonylcarbamoyl transferase component Bud32